MSDSQHDEQDELQKYLEEKPNKNKKRSRKLSPSLNMKLVCLERVRRFMS